jgi:hypothetical protein
MVLLLSILCGELCLLVSWCAGDRCDMASGDEVRDRSMRPHVEDRGWSSTGRILGGRMVERSGDAVCGLYHAQEDKEHEFLGLASKPRSVVWPQNHWVGFLGLGLKTGSYGSVIWTSKSPQ